MLTLITGKPYLIHEGFGLNWSGVIVIVATTVIVDVVIVVAVAVVLIRNLKTPRAFPYFSNLFSQGLSYALGD